MWLGSRSEQPAEVFKSRPSELPSSVVDLATLYEKNSLPASPENFLVGIVKSVGKESFILETEKGEVREIKIAQETKVLRQTKQGQVVIDEIQKNWQVGCVMFEDKEIAKIIYLISSNL